MSGGSYNYLCQRMLAGDFAEAESDLRRMADALERAGYPVVAKRTRAAADLVAKVHAEASDMSALWRAQEWLESGDWGPSRVRREAIRLGEELPECHHPDVRRQYANIGDRVGHYVICQVCDWHVWAP